MSRRWKNLLKWIVGVKWEIFLPLITGKTTKITGNLQKILAFFAANENYARPCTDIQSERQDAMLKAVSSNLSDIHIKLQLTFCCNANTMLVVTLTNYFQQPRQIKQVTKHQQQLSQCTISIVHCADAMLTKCMHLQFTQKHFAPNRQTRDLNRKSNHWHYCFKCYSYSHSLHVGTPCHVIHKHTNASKGKGKGVCKLFMEIHLTATECHLLYGITVLPATQHKRTHPASTPACLDLPTTTSAVLYLNATNTIFLLIQNNQVHNARDRITRSPQSWQMCTQLKHSAVPTEWSRKCESKWLEHFHVADNVQPFPRFKRCFKTMGKMLPTLNC